MVLSGYFQHILLATRESGALFVYARGMERLEYITVSCPYCGESNELTVERADESQSYAEDCQVCCCSMLIDVSGLGDEMHVSIQREDD